MLKDKVALVTGAAQGIGLGISKAFAATGADVVLADYNPKVTEVADSLNADSTGQITGLVMDVTDDASIAAGLATLPKLDFAINNAGGGVLKPFAELTNDDFDKTVGLDLYGTFKCMRAELQFFLKQGSGSIVNTGALSSFFAPGGFGAYNAAKNGIIGMTRAAAVDYADAGIRVNCIAPGLTKTPLNSEAFMTTMVKTVPMKRYETVEELAKVFVFVASEATFMTGQTIVIDGGASVGLKQEG